MAVKLLENRFDRLATPHEFARRLVWSALTGLAFISVSLLVGMAGYHFLEGHDWLDAFLNASMILAGMGPVDMPKSGAGKMFAGVYALYSGFAVLIGAAIIFTPVIHRGLHRFHLDDGDDDSIVPPVPRAQARKARKAAQSGPGAKH